MLSAPFHIMQAAYLARRRPKKPTGLIIYNGPSLLDGSPIAVIALHHTTNTKTADTVQTYIIRRDADPITANRTGLDFGICGTCPQKGTPNDNDSGYADDRGCYVALIHGPLAVYKALRRHQYPDYSNAPDLIRAAGAGREVRIGTYGDGAAVPRHVWDNLLADCTGHTAYSHQALTLGSSFDAALYMRSVQDLPEAMDAWKDGARTFRVIARTDELTPAEILCPASKEMNYKTTCARCGLCAGNTLNAKSIAIVAHGTGARNAVGAKAA
jgi:hypothetical protein